MRTSIKSLLHLVGNILAVVGIGFVAMKIWGYAGEIDLTRLTPALWVAIAGLAIVYGCANLLLAYGWQKLLAQLGQQAGTRWCIRTYGLSQIAKYVPGNIFHFAGRQAMGMSHGISGWVLARSTLWELALLCISGSLFAVLVIPALYPSFPVLWACGLFLLLVVISAALIQRIIGTCAAQAQLAYLFFLSISGAIFAILTACVASSQIDYYPVTLAGGFVIAWLVGLLTPGAPAGVGVREAVLLILFDKSFPGSELLLCVLLGRLITVLGDFLYFTYSSLLIKNDRT
jgi:FtsH-binding integral membrane protein